MCVHVFLLKIKFHSLDEKVCRPRMLWLHVALTCNSHLFGRVGRSAHDTRIFLEAIDNPRIKFPKPPEGSNMCMCVCVCVYMIINVILFFFAIFNFKKLYAFTGKYYLVVSGYPIEYGFLGPYRG